VSCQSDDREIILLKDKLVSMGFLKVTCFNSKMDQPVLSVIELKKFAVIFFSTNYGPNQKEWGDALAAFIEDNSFSTPRSVILGVYSNMIPSYNLMGGWKEKNYDPWIVSDKQNGCKLSLTFSIPHPIMNGVNTITGTTTMVDVTSGSNLVIARCEDKIFIAEKRISKFATVIGMNFYHVNLSSSFWDSDGSRLMENAFQYACTPQFENS